MRSSYNHSPNSTQQIGALKSKRLKLIGMDNEGRNNQSGVTEQVIANRSRLTNIVKGNSREFMHNHKSGSFSMAGENFQLD
jgi:hypothetical protein